MLRGFFLDYLGFELDRAIEPADWLTFREQKLQTITAGANSHDEIGHDEIGLQAVRDHRCPDAVRPLLVKGCVTVCDGAAPICMHVCGPPSFSCYDRCACES